jgi:hypothetical protein
MQAAQILAADSGDESDDELLLKPNWYRDQRDAIQGRVVSRRRVIIDHDDSSDDELDVIPIRRR